MLIGGKKLGFLFVDILSPLDKGLKGLISKLFLILNLYSIEDLSPISGDVWTLSNELPDGLWWC